MSFQQAKQTIRHQIDQFNWVDKELILTNRKHGILPGSKYANTRSQCLVILDQAIQELHVKKKDAETLLLGLNKSDFDNTSPTDQWIDNLRTKKKDLKKIEDEATRIINTAITEVEGRERLEGYDAFIFINLDYAVDDNTTDESRINQANPNSVRVKGRSGYGLGLGLGIRKKQVIQRGIAVAPSRESHPANWRDCITVRSYPLAHNPAKLYIEITLENPRYHFDPVDIVDSNGNTIQQYENYLELFNRIGVPDIKEFSHLTLNSKIQIAGHGAFGIDYVVSDAKSLYGVENFAMPIEAICRLISENIRRNSRVLFDSWLNPLKLESQSCQAGGLDGGGNLEVNGTNIEVVSVDSTGAITRKSFSIEETMAGKFLTHLKAQGVWAQIKARTTSSQSVKTTERSRVWDTADRLTNKTGQPTDRYARPDLVRAGGTYSGAAQQHRVAALINRDQGLRTVMTNTGTGLDKKTFQGPGLARQHGLKRFFYYALDANNQEVLRCKDLANDSEVDLFFEANKDRALLYIAYNLKRLHNASIGNIGAKKNKLFDLIFAVEASDNYQTMVQAIRDMANDQDISAHRNKVSSFFGGQTTTVTVLTRLAALIDRSASSTTAADRLIPLPRPNSVALGLT